MIPRIEKRKTKPARRGPWLLILAAAALLFLAWGNGPAAAQDPPAAPTAAETMDRSVTETVESALAAEKSALETLKSQIEEKSRQAKELAADINVYRVQASAHGNLLLIPDAPVEDLERAQGLNLAALKEIDAHLAEMVAQKQQEVAALARTDDQIELVKKQRQDIRKTDISEASRRNIEKQSRALESVLSAKKKLFEKNLALSEKGLGSLQEVKSLYSALEEKYNQRMPRQRTRTLLERRRVLKSLSPAALKTELDRMRTETKRWIAPEFWKTNLAAALAANAPLVLASVLMYLAALVLMARLRKRIDLRLQGEPAEPRPCLFLGLKLVRRTLVPGATLVLALVLKTVPTQTDPLLFLHLVIILCQGVLIYRWAALAARSSAGQKIPVLTETHGRRLRYLAVGFVAVALAHAWAEPALGQGSGLLFLMRLAAVAALILWNRVFWGRLGSLTDTKTKALAGLCHSVAAAGLLMDLTGWGSLAIHWFSAWAWTLAVSIWASTGLQVILEWERSFAAGRASSGPESIRPADHARWALIRFSWLGWAAAVLAALITAWDGNQGLWSGLYRIVNQSFAVGTLNLHLLGMIYAVLILFAVHVAVRLWKSVVMEKILARQTMDRGLRESVTTISVYLIWALGVIMALGAVGVSTTSLAVVFGALSIGIGFGLQNIFNNFISGIILLFERPIQVGDAVEINGIWGEIKKINVRATVVQTYDNASLIIPNSEFISSQVTNWSFKDKRLRRKVQVGVAYGSDVELTRKTLLEIAEQTPRVLKYPRPDVIFLDHGDSALIFTLRYWTTVDEIFVTETDIRFAIDRLFAERGLEIAFPQRDIHIRSLSGLPQGLACPLSGSKEKE